MAYALNIRPAFSAAENAAAWLDPARGERLAATRQAFVSHQECRLGLASSMRRCNWLHSVQLLHERPPIMMQKFQWPVWVSSHLQEEPLQPRLSMHRSAERFAPYKYHLHRSWVQPPCTDVQCYCLSLCHTDQATSDHARHHQRHKFFCHRGSQSD